MVYGPKVEQSLLEVKPNTHFLLINQHYYKNKRVTRLGDL